MSIKDGADASLGDVPDLSRQYKKKVGEGKAKTHSNLLIFSPRGKVFTIRAEADAPDVQVTGLPSTFVRKDTT